MELSALDVRRAETDADLEAWRGVQLAVLPDERAPSVAELRRAQQPHRLLLLAELDGRPVGSGLADRSSLRGHGYVEPLVVAGARRGGVGTELLRGCAAHLRALGIADVLAHVDARVEGSVAFAHRFGFVEVDRQVEQVKRLGEEPAPEFPPGIEVSSIAERPDLLRPAYELAVQAYADLATPWPATITVEEWLREEATYPSGSFVALAAGEVVGYSGLLRDTDDDTRAEDGLTAVRRDRRRRGLARSLKRAELAWAASNGIREIYTWTQRGNEGMRRLNELLGYEYRHVSLTMGAPLEQVEARLNQGRSAPR